MAIFRIEKDKNYTVMSNHHLRDKDLSLKAKGLLSYMLSLPEDWDYSINGLVAVSKEGVKAIKNILRELQLKKYLLINKKQNEKGLFEYEYLIYEYPQYQKGEVDKGEVEKDIQINTKEINTNNKDKIDKTEDTLDELLVEMENSKEELNHPLTDELIKSKYITSDDSQIGNYNKLFDKLKEEGCTYNSLLNSIYYIVPKVLERKFIDENGELIQDKFKYLQSSIISNNKKLKEINKMRNSNKGLWDNYEL